MFLGAQAFGRTPKNQLVTAIQYRSLKFQRSTLNQLTSPIRADHFLPQVPLSLFISAVNMKSPLVDVSLQFMPSSKPPFHPLQHQHAI